ncbi:tRNA(His) guanylyltransferase Thg1 family protein [Dactylosporangium darangshiense]|uniref:tRNAHis guanylyltransferase catalytic domain-containing protein n=1 Tax=Dactylosporangium darangshiense TaxID=579108 RepID=A0ABP8D9M7_9ACTN
MDGLGDRMKAYERATRAVLPRRTYTVVRVDGRAFHSYLRGAERPFDAGFMAAMDGVAEALCTEISGAVLAYTQSDEVSVLVTDFAAPGTEPWFGGVVQKWCSVAASLATATLNARRPGATALFDARAFTIADPADVAAYLLWRQRDAVRNSIAMAAQSVFPHRRLQGLHSGALQELLFAEAGINWNDYPPQCRRGRLTARTQVEREVRYTHQRTGEEHTAVIARGRWETGPAPHFTAAGLTMLIPGYPPLAQEQAAAQP